MAVDGLDERRHVFWRRELADAMAEVEDVTAAATEAVERGDRLGLHVLRRREQRHRLEVALPADAVAHATSRGTEIGRPVEAHDARAGVADRLEPLAAALGEH